MKTRNRIFAVAIAATLALGISASSAFAQEPLIPPPLGPMLQPVPAAPETVTERLRPNRAALGLGAGVLGAAYVPSFISAASSGRNGDQYLYVPVAGPWIDLASRGGCGPVGCGREAIYKTMLVVSGIAQAYGAAAIVTAFLAPETRSVPVTTGARVVPTTMGKSGYGLSLVGAF